MIIKQDLKIDFEIKNVSLFFKGTGNPQDNHEIIGVSFKGENNNSMEIGLCTLYDMVDYNDYIFENETY